MPIYSPEMLRWGKIYRRKKHPQPSAPNFLYKEALSEPYNSAKFPAKPSAARTFRPDGVKKLPTRIVSNPSRDGGGELGIRTLGRLLFTAFRVLHLRPLGQLSI